MYSSYNTVLCPCSARGDGVVKLPCFQSHQSMMQAVPDGKPCFIMSVWYHLCICCISHTFLLLFYDVCLSLTKHLTSQPQAGLLGGIPENIVITGMTTPSVFLPLGPSSRTRCGQWYWLFWPRESLGWCVLVCSLALNKQLLKNRKKKRKECRNICRKINRAVCVWQTAHIHL